MQIHIYNALAELGVPVTECPTCKMENWAFSGDVHKGIVNVWCLTCGRRYERMTGFEEIEWLANRLALAARVHESPLAGRIHAELCHSVTEARMGGWGYSHLVVTSEGVRENSDDEPPF